MAGYSVIKTTWKDRVGKKLVTIFIAGTAGQPSAILKHYGKSFDMMEVEVFASGDRSRFSKACMSVEGVAARHGYKSSAPSTETVVNASSLKVAIGPAYWYQFGAKNLIALFTDADTTDVREPGAAKTPGAPEPIAKTKRYVLPKDTKVSFPDHPNTDPIKNAPSIKENVEKKRIEEIYANDPLFGAF